MGGNFSLFDFGDKIFDGRIPGSFLLVKAFVTTEVAKILGAPSDIGSSNPIAIDRSTFGLLELSSKCCLASGGS